MKRKALIVGCDFEFDTDPLEGVKHDVRNFKGYLKSLKGGAWNDNEIISLLTSDKSEIRSAIESIKSEKNDLVYCVFSGHGSYYEPRQERKLYVNDNAFLFEKDFDELAPKQINIFDTCANVEVLVEKSEARVQDSMESYDSINDVVRHMQRAKFEELVTNCSPQLVNLYSSSIGEGSGDDSKKGAFYIQNLLQAATSNTENVMSIIGAHNTAIPSVIEISKGKQNPSYNVFPKARINLPFSIN